MFKRILSILTVISLLLFNTVFARADVISDAQVFKSRIGQMITTLLGTAGCYVSNSNLTIDNMYYQYLNHLFGSYDENAPEGKHKAAFQMLNNMGIGHQVYDSRDMENIQKYEGAILYSQYLSSGRTLVLYYRDDYGQPVIGNFVDYVDNITIAMPADYADLVADCVNFFKQFFDFSVNDDITNAENIDCTGDDFANYYFGNFGWKLLHNFTYGSDYSNYQNGDLACRIFYNSGTADIVFNRTYSTSSTNNNFYFYLQGTFYQWGNYLPNISVNTYDNWIQQSVNGNMVSWIQLGTKESKGILYPSLQIGSMEFPFTDDEENPYYIYGIYMFGKFFNFSGISLDNIGNEVTPPEDMTIDDDSLFNNSDDVTNQDVIDFIDKKIDNVTDDLEKLDLNAPAITSDGVVEPPVQYITYNNTTNNTYNPDTKPIENNPLPDVELPDINTTVESGNDTLDSLQIGGLMGRFPFCIPQDIYNILEVLNSDPLAPVFKLRMPTPMLAKKFYEFNVDLNPYNNLAALVRRLELVGFTLGLALITRDIIRG